MPMDASYEADEILRLLLGYPREALFLRGGDVIEEALCEKAVAIARGRGDGTPLAYLLGVSPFFGRDFLCAPGCLIPRADTECLVEEAISRLPDGGILWDLCTGTGCVPVSVLCERRDARAYALDLYPVPLELAEKNRIKHGVCDRLTVERGDVLRGDVPMGAPAPHVITANPPYIRSSVCQTLDKGVKKEPLTALDGGEDGMIFYRAILTRYAEHQTPGGLFLFEIGYDQEEEIRALAAELGMACSVRCDYEGRPRVACIRP